MKWIAAIKRYWRCTKGTTAVEFALVAPIAILLFLCILEVGRALYTRHELSYAIDLGARRVLLDPDTQDQDVSDTVRLGLSAAIRAQVIIETRIVADTLGTHRLVEASVPYAFVLPILPTGAFMLSVQRRVPVM